MTTFKAACVQLRSGRSVEQNTADVERMVRQAAAGGATYVQTPEMTTLLEMKRADLMEKISLEADDPSLKRYQALAAETGVTLHIGSMAVLMDDGKVANRGYVIGADGAIKDYYDKIHTFDVDLPGGESYRESNTYRNGHRAVCVDLDWGRLGMGICYDMRFPDLFRAQARAGAHILTAPAAFTRQTGEAHWHLLLRTRAVENGCFVIAAAQAGQHEDGRETYGHSIMIDPWGTVIGEADREPGVVYADIDLSLIDKIRGQIPALANERDFDLPEQAAAAPSLRSVS